MIGIYRPECGAIQLVGEGVRDTTLYDVLRGVETLVTFNGSGFDLPSFAGAFLSIFGATSGTVTSCTSVDNTACAVVSKLSKNIRASDAQRRE